MKTYVHQIGVFRGWGYSNDAHPLYLIDLDPALLNTLCHTCYGTWCIRQGSHVRLTQGREEWDCWSRIVMCHANANTMWGVTAHQTSALESSARFMYWPKQGAQLKWAKHCTVWVPRLLQLHLFSV